MALSPEPEAQGRASRGSLARGPANPYPPVGTPDLCYDLGGFHPPPCLVSLDYPYLFCTTCRVVAHIDLVAPHILPQDIHHRRTEWPPYGSK